MRVAMTITFEDLTRALRAVADEMADGIESGYFPQREKARASTGPERRIGNGEDHGVGGD